MNITVIKGIELVLIRSGNTAGQGEEMEVCFGHPHLPVAVVRFVIPHERGHGDAADHGADDIEPGIPLIVVLPVIHEVAHIDDVKLIAKKEKLEPSDKEYEEGMQEYADKAGADLDTYKEQVGEDVLKDAILRDKVLDYLVDNCVQVEQSDKN